MEMEKSAHEGSPSVCGQVNTCEMPSTLPRWIFASCFGAPKSYLSDMPRCLSCSKGFKDAASVAMHMTQPTSGCNTWVNDLVRLQEEELGLPSTSAARNLSLSAHDSYASDLPAAGAFHDGPDAMAIDDDELYEPTFIPNTQIEEHFPGVAQTFGKGQMFLDKFNTDKFCHHRRENLYYPFVSRPEWHLALWLLRSGISMSATDEFLSLEIVSFHLNFGVSPIIHHVLSRSKHCASRLILQRNYVDMPSCYQVGHAGNPCRSKLLTRQRLPCICTGAILWTALHPSSIILYLPTTWNSSLAMYTQQRQGNIVYIQSG